MKNLVRNLVLGGASVICVLALYIMWNPLSEHADPSAPSIPSLGNIVHVQTVSLSAKPALTLGSVKKWSPFMAVGLAILVGFVVFIVVVTQKREQVEGVVKDEELGLGGESKVDDESSGFGWIVLLVTAVMAPILIIGGVFARRITGGKDADDIMKEFVQVGDSMKETVNRETGKDKKAADGKGEKTINNEEKVTPQFATISATDSTDPPFTALPVDLEPITISPLVANDTKDAPSYSSPVDSTSSVHIESNPSTSAEPQKSTGGRSRIFNLVKIPLNRKRTASHKKASATISAVHGVDALARDTVLATVTDV